MEDSNRAPLIITLLLSGVVISLVVIIALLYIHRKQQQKKWVMQRARFFKATQQATKQREEEQLLPADDDVIAQDEPLISNNLASAPVSPAMNGGESIYNFARSMSYPSMKVQLLDDADVDKLWTSSVTMAAGGMTSTKSKCQFHCANGKIKFTLVYSANNELRVKINEFDDLPLSRGSGISVPFVKVYMYPQSAHAYPQDEINRTNSRVEVLCFPRETSCTFARVGMSLMCQSALKFVILDYDRFSRSEFVAECVVMLDEENLEGEIITKHLSIKKTQMATDVGNLLVSLCYQPNGNRMSIIILKCTGLQEMEGRFSDHYVKITLIRDGVVLDKRRTRTVKKNSFPVFNDNLVFPVDEHVMRNLVLVFEVMRHESKLKQERVGNVILGNHCSLRQVTPLEIQHFNEMLTSPTRQIAEWHKLVP